MITQRKQSASLTVLWSFFLIMTTMSCHAYYNKIEGWAALKNYVDNCVAQLFYPNHDSHELNALKRTIADAVHNDQAGWFQMWVSYSQERTYEIILDEVVRFIGREARRLGNMQVSAIICKEVKQKIMHASELPVGVFSEYIGGALKQKVERLMPHEPKPQTHQNLYPSEECCICYSAFDGSVEQIFLVPCGHDLCKECCKQYFFDHGNTTCPKCRAKINITQLRESVYREKARYNNSYAW